MPPKRENCGSAKSIATWLLVAKVKQMMVVVVVMEKDKSSEP